MPLRALAVLAGILIAGTAVGQTTVTGRVTDAETGDPLPSVHVYLSGTATGTTTDLDGRYTLAGVPDGPHELVASFLGYEPGVASVQGGAQSVGFRLQPRSTHLSGVTVEADRSRWSHYLDAFQRALVGTTRDARGVRLLNPEVIAFDEEEDGLLRAVGEGPLRMENRSLGYLVEYDLMQFELLGDAVAFWGHARFEPLAPDDDRQRRRWARARQRAYEGSFAHFVHTLADGALGRSKFRIYRANTRHRMKPAQARGEHRLLGIESASSVLRRVDGENAGLITADPALYLRVDYTGEREERGYGRDDAAVDARFAREPDRQVSWVETPEGGVRVDLRAGQLDGGAGVRPLLISGYWAWDERAAHWLPADYRPDG